MWWGSRSKRASLRSQKPGVDSEAIVRAESDYTRLMVAGSRVAIGGGLLLLFGLAAMAYFSSLNEEEGVGFTSPLLTAEQGGSALLVILPVALALQVLVRMPRDPDTGQVVEVIARRQFWGSIAQFSAVGAAFVGTSVFLGAFLAGQRAGELDPAGIFGVPLGALAGLIISIDASTVARLEAEYYKLDAAHAKQRIDERRAVIARIGGRSSHARRSICIRSLVTGAPVLALGAWWSAGLFDGVEFGVAYGVVSAILIVVAVGFLMQYAPGALRGAVTETILMAVMFALLLAVEGASLAIAASEVLGKIDPPWGYVQSMAYGLSASAGPVLVAGSLLIARRSHQAISPLMAFVVERLHREIRQIQERTTIEGTESWRTYAWAALLTCLVPVAAFPSLLLASWHRRGAQSGSGLFVSAWVIVPIVALAETIFVVMWPAIAVSSGWVSISREASAILG